MTKAEALRSFVNRTQGVPVIWGESDCSTWPAQWIIDQTGANVEWPEYSTREEAQQIIDAAGGLDAVWHEIATEAGLERVWDAPILGDIGIIDTRLYGYVGGIFADGGAFCWRAEKGVLIMSPNRNYIKGIWRIR